MMSKTIEYINEEIKKTEKIQRMLETVYHSPRDKVSERKLKILQQIKCELEAWEVAKNKDVHINKIKEKNNVNSYNSYLVIQLTEEEFNKLKKALEAENEN